MAAKTMTQREITKLREQRGRLAAAVENPRARRCARVGNRTLLLLWMLMTIALLMTAVPGAMAENQPGDATTSMVGNWELSNAEHDKSCAIAFKADAAGPGHGLDINKTCPELFPEMREVVAWVVGSDEALRLLDAKGKPVLEFIEVENGLFEPLHPGTSLYFLQTMAAAQGRDRTADSMFGDWAFVRGSGKQLCQMSLLNEAADPESFALTLKPGCDALVTGFAPKGWRLDRGLLLLLSSRGDPWRFEEGDTGTWHRLPEGRQPLLLVKQP